MFCPRCGQAQVNEDTRFCSRCGFLMQGMLDVIAKGGLPPEVADRSAPGAVSPKKRGVKQGGLMMLSSLILVPVTALLVALIGLSPPVVALTAIVTFWGGFLRILYALIFQSNVPTTQPETFVESVTENLTGIPQGQKVLPPQQSVPISESYQPRAGHWRETSDLQPNSVTEKTTRTLNNKEMK